MTHFLVRMHVAGEQCRDRVLDWESVAVPAFRAASIV